MAGIGHVCIQWALLENNLLGILACCQNVKIEEAAILFGGLDMKPRIGVAIKLAQYHKWSPPLQRGLRDLRSKIERFKLVDKRNMLIHGVHKPSEKPQHFVLYSPRKSGTAQQEEWSIFAVLEVGNHIHSAALEAQSIFDAYGAWKFPGHSAENVSGEFVTTPTNTIARIKQDLRASFDHLWRRIF